MKTSIKILVLFIGLLFWNNFVSAQVSDVLTAYQEGIPVYISMNENKTKDSVMKEQVDKPIIEAEKQNQKENKTLAEKLIGIWVPTDSGGGYEKKAAFKSDNRGIEFKENGKLLKRQNAGWCGTPPIAYENAEGTWKQTSDSTIAVVYSYWGGEIEQNWLIISVDDKRLEIQ